MSSSKKDQQYFIDVAGRFGHIARAAKALVVTEPMAIFHPRDGKS